MSFLHVKLRMAVVFFILISVVFFDVMANKKNSIKPGRRNINCTRAWRSVANSRSNFCRKNESTVTIRLNNSEGEYEGILLMFNQTDCKASLLSETIIRDITEACNVTQRKQGHRRKEQGAQIPVDNVYQERLQVTIRGNVEGQDESSRYKIGLKISFKNRRRTTKQYNILTRLKGHGSIKALYCLLLSTCRAKTDSCACSVQAVFTTLGPELKPRLPEKGRNKRRTVKRNTVGFCFVLLFLVLEMSVCVILPHIVAKSKYRRNSSVEVENSTSNPSYQIGPQLLPSSYSSPLQDADQESYQPPYQPLVENTRVPGGNTGYLRPVIERGEASRLVAADPASYQDLDQSEQREHGYQKSLTQEDETGKPFYHVPEKTAAKEGIRSTSGTLRDPMYYVVKELKSVNANACEKFRSENSVDEPIYCVLEDPREIEEKNTKDDKF